MQSYKSPDHCSQKKALTCCRPFPRRSRLLSRAFPEPSPLFLECSPTRGLLDQLPSPCRSITPTPRSMSFLPSPSCRGSAGHRHVLTRRLLGGETQGAHVNTRGGKHASRTVCWGEGPPRMKRTGAPLREVMTEEPGTRGWEGGGEDSAVGTHGGTWSSPTWRGQSPCPSSFPGSPLLSHLFVQLTPPHPPLSAVGQAQGWPRFHPGIQSQCLANRWSSVNACDFVKQQ